MIIESRLVGKNSGLTLAIVYALLATIFFTIEAMAIRYLDIKAGIPGDITAFCYLFFEGCIGTAALLIYTAMGHGLFDFELQHALWVFGGGVLITIGLVL